ncbi:MAG: tRNA (guanosine(37)-N1)-methyltransferase TrmD [Chloroflexi bacterium]|nr:tRNA (guanosine(37)-N1)-methyltransferase TrmD [Chloroflexota bacterium]
MLVHVFTLFPEMFQGPFQASILKRAQAGGLLEVRLHQVRDHAHDRHRIVDDAPYGGGPGMILKPEPLFEAVESVLGTALRGMPVVLLSPQGRLFTQAEAQRLAREPAVALLCGHYGGVDERIREQLATDELSIGDYVLTGGELAAMVVVDAVSRLLPGVLGSEEAAAQDSHARGLLQYPQYTRPPVFRGWKVPEVLLSGDHGAVGRWRTVQSLRRTQERRPDLLERASLTPEERRLLDELQAHRQQEER